MPKVNISAAALVLGLTQVGFAQTTLSSAGSTDTGVRFFQELNPQPRVVEIVTPANDRLSLRMAPVNSIPSLREQSLGPPAPFTAPSLFSAPLPTGSGSRGLGLAGAFTAIADDASAASYNPAGLIQVETPEASFVYRHSRVRNQHHSTNPDLEVGSDDYESDGLNYASITLPFQFPGTGWNAVFSLNHQEAYDFTQEFHAHTRDRGSQTLRRRATGQARASQTDRFSFEGGITELTLRSDLTTRSVSELKQTIRTEFEGLLRFSQRGAIESSTPALAVEITPRLFVGGALNFHQDSPWPGRDIRSRTRVDYRSSSDSRTEITNTQTTTGTYTLDGVLHVPVFPPFDFPLPTSTGTLPSFTDQEVLHRRSVRTTEGHYEETNRYEDLEGANATFGVLYAPGRYLTLGAAVDLPWSADTTQTRSIRHEVVTRDGAGRELGREVLRETDETGATFDFPLFWNVGAAVHWTSDFFTSLDAGRTHWSDFAFTGGSGPKTNPLNGGAADDGQVEDTWNLRLGTEYCWMTGAAALPFRAGLVREERPAIGAPDVYHGFSLGSGARFRRVWFDLAYQYLEADDVQTVLPSNPALRTDTRQHQVFATLVVHF